MLSDQILTSIGNHVFEEIGKSFTGTSRATVRRWPLGDETLDPFRVDAPSQLHSDISQALQYNDKPHTVEVEHLDGVRQPKDAQRTFEQASSVRSVLTVHRGKLQGTSRNCRTIQVLPCQSVRAAR